MRTRYWHRHPRGFANECEAVATHTKAKELELYRAGYRNITRRELEQHIAWINHENDAWGSNRAFGKMELPRST